MENVSRPTIKGVYVNSHIRALQRERGESGLQELQKRFGRPMSYTYGMQVPVSDEARILEIIVDMTAPTLLSEAEREIEAGRLHFRNFATTNTWRVLRLLFGRRLKFVLMHSANIAQRVFEGTEFVSSDEGSNRVKIVATNNEYPILHFKGFFEQWMRHLGIEGEVSARELEPRRHEYLVSWK